jgi:DnaJ family protein A protein 2
MFGGNFFQGFAEGDDDDHHHHEEQDEEVDNDAYYNILGVSKDATTDEIRKVYKRLAVQNHPDKGGDAAKFKEITEAANVLMDEKKREVYDRYGKKGLDAGMDERSGGEDLMSMLFGGGGQQKQRIAPIRAKLPLPLEAFYNGKSIPIKIPRKRVCQSCEGSGSSVANATTTCDECNGQGVKIVLQRFGPGLTQQMRTRCGKCQGHGDYIPEDRKCKECHGKKIADEEKEFNVVIEKGMKNNESIVFHGEGHLVPSIEPGDVEFILACQKHPTFTRKGNDLRVQVTISLTEAFGHSKIFLQHLDKRILSIDRPHDHIIRPGDVMCVRNEGMPKRENPYFKGDLYIDFVVTFPSELPPTVRATLIEQLSSFCPPLANLDAVKAQKNKKQQPMESDDDEDHDEDEDVDIDGEHAEKHKKKSESSDQQQEDEEDVSQDIVECEMTTVNPEQFGSSGGGYKEAYDDEDDEAEGEGRGGVGCQQM